MAEDKTEGGRWITIKGTHVYLAKGEGITEAIRKLNYKNRPKYYGSDTNNVNTYLTKPKAPEDIYDRAVLAEPQITKAVKQIAEEFGIELVGLENRLKTFESYMRKAEAKTEIRDTIRYTGVISSEKYAENTIKFLDFVKEKGYNVIVVKNTWQQGSQYKGINTFIKSPNGQIFEMQFHTPESYELKSGESHKLYEKQRLLKTHSIDFNEIRDELIRMSDKLTTPNGVEEVR